MYPKRKLAEICSKSTLKAPDSGASITVVTTDGYSLLALKTITFIYLIDAKMKDGRQLMDNWTTLPFALALFLHFKNNFQ